VGFTKIELVKLYNDRGLSTRHKPEEAEHILKFRRLGYDCKVVWEDELEDNLKTLRAWMEG